MEFKDYIQFRDFLLGIKSEAGEAAVDYVLDNRSDYPPEVVDACLKGWAIYMSADENSDISTYVLTLYKESTTYKFTVPHEVMAEHLSPPDVIRELEVAIFAYEKRMTDEVYEMILNSDHRLSSTARRIGADLAPDGLPRYDSIEVLGTDHGDETVEFLMTSSDPFENFEIPISLSANIFPSISYRFSAEAIERGRSF